MEDDELLEALARTARAEDLGGDPRWEALSAGALSEEQRAELAAEARGAGRAGRAMEAFEPLGAEVREKITDRLLGVIEEERGRATANTNANATTNANANANANAMSELRRRRSFFVAIAAAALVIAGLIMRGASVAPLPAYAVAVAGGAQPVRSTDAPVEVERVPPGSRLEITLRPATRVEGAVEVRAFLVHDGAMRPWGVSPAITEGGVVTVAGTREALFGDRPAGRWEMVLAVGRGAAMPAAADPLVEGPGLRVLRHAVLLVDRGD
jgi:hypothetical protein